MAIRIKTKEEIAILRECGRRLAGILRRVIAEVRPGVSTAELDRFAEQLIIAEQGIPIFKNYKIKEAKTAFPASICASINDEVVHGIPRRDRILREGDIVGIDVGMRWNGLVTDMAETVGVGAISAPAEQLIRATREALDAGIGVIRHGARIGDVGAAVEARLKKDNLGIIRDLAGHGVGYELHEPPLIQNYGKPGTGLELREGMVLAIEPMATLGSPRITLDADEWTFRTKDGSLAAHFEYTIAVTESGAEVLTFAV